VKAEETQEGTKFNSIKSGFMYNVQASLDKLAIKQIFPLKSVQSEQVNTRSKLGTQINFVLFYVKLFFEFGVSLFHCSSPTLHRKNDL
jgi:hypothetical protein